MKILNKIHVLLSKNKKKFFLFLLWVKVIIYFIYNRKKIQNSDSYLEYKFILKNGISCFPYSFVQKYKNMKVNVLYYDKFPYVLENDFKIYFNPDWSIRKIANYYKEISLEQNINSPHCYYNKGINYSQYDIAIDIGAAEGNFTTYVVEKINNIYLFENDEVWFDCLKRTFQQYEKKVEIVRKYVGDYDDDFNVKLDSMSKFYGKNILVKIDVEGNELNVLKGMVKILSQNKLITLLICTYHKQNDEIILSTFLSNLGYSNTFSSGYMCYFYDKNLKKPYLRKALMFSTKKEII
jgi:hypothetical protein